MKMEVEKKRRRKRKNNFDFVVFWKLSLVYYILL